MHAFCKRVAKFRDTYAATNTIHNCAPQVRSPVFKALLDAPMREGKEGVVTIQDVRAPVFRTLLHFVYTDSLPEVRPLFASCLQVRCS